MRYFFLPSLWGGDIKFLFQTSSRNKKEKQQLPIKIKQHRTKRSEVNELFDFMRDVLNEVKYILTWINNKYLINKNK
ncbi:hypothetical protein ACQ27_gp017 [Klebsiella phage K64-1]|uniref:hypothetical protein n=1 Tax=Klebsiella phage K64-1 TaxID=1439894 RepID=UPI00248C24F2|nr:hypothetical protein ACQ27_gp017 [Klebsiella phage K64-1]